MDVVHQHGVKLYHVKLVFGQKTQITVTDAGNSFNAVTVPKTADKRAYYVVKPGAQTSAAYNAGVNMSRRKINLLPGTRALQCL